MTTTFSWNWKLQWVAIAPKPSSALSIFACVYVIKRIVMNRNRRSSVYHRLVLAMSIFSLFGSITAFIGTWAIPVGTPGVYLSSGTNTTCSIQGFCIQMFLLGGPLYYSSLSVYYFLTINRGWTENELKCTEKWLHSVPLFISVSTSIAGGALNLYHNAQTWCWIAPPAKNAGTYRMGFFYIPSWASLLLGTVVMIAIFRCVLQQERSTDKYSIRGNFGSVVKRRKHARMVAKQASAYVAAFYITLTFPSIVRISQMLDGSTHFAFIALSSIFAPLGGFFSSAVYLRPHFLQYRRQHPKLSFSQFFSSSIHKKCKWSDSVLHRKYALKRSSKIFHDIEDNIQNQGNQNTTNMSKENNNSSSVRFS